jgi:hypothetical protein
MKRFISKQLSIFAVLILGFYSSNAIAYSSDTIHIHDSNQYKGFHLLDSVVQDYDIFINGENHTYLDANSKLWVKMFKYLNKTAGVRNIMIEYGYASGWLINEYIQTGDTALFSVIKTYAYGQYASAYKELMEYNRTLDSNNKIYLTGIDLERGIYSASKVLSMQFPEDAEPHDSIALHVESLKSLVIYNEIEVFDPDNDYNFYKSYDVRSTIDNIITNFDSHEQLYKGYLKDNFELFKRILLGIKDLKIYNQYEEENSTHKFVYRERYMYQQFKKEYKAKQGKFFGQFGRCHITKNTQTETSCNWYNFKSLANRIAQNGAAEGKKLKVFTTGIFYHSGEHDEDEMKGMQSHMDSLFAELEDNRLALYDLPNDSALNNRLENMFNYLILCTYESNKEYGASIRDIDKLINPPSQSKVSIFLSVGVDNIDFQEMNTHLSVQDGNGFTDNALFWSITMGSREPTIGLSSLAYFGSYLPQNIEINDTVSARMKGFVYKSLSGYDIFKKKQWIDLLAGFGFSYHNLKLDILKKTETVDALSGYVGQESISTVNNPALLLDFFTNLNFNFNHFSIGSTFGYSLDLSEPNWRADKRLLSASPKTSLTGIFGSVNIGVNFGG